MGLEIALDIIKRNENVRTYNNQRSLTVGRNNSGILGMKKPLDIFLKIWYGDIERMRNG